MQLASSGPALMVVVARCRHGPLSSCCCCCRQSGESGESRDNGDVSLLMHVDGAQT
jgi:hypothetical protein